MDKRSTDFAEAIEQFNKLADGQSRMNVATEKAAAIAKVFGVGLHNNISETIEREKQDRINRKWQRIFIALIITNIIIYSQII